MKCYKNIITGALYMDIIPPKCSMYWKEISYNEYLKWLEYEALCEEIDNELMEEEWEQEEEFYIDEDSWEFRVTLSGFLAGRY